MPGHVTLPSGGPPTGFVGRRAHREGQPERGQRVKKVIFQFSVSLDGYVEGPNHEIDWHLVDDEFNAYAVEMLNASDVLIMGRRTYELMAGYWPTAADNDPVVKELMNSTPKLVFSRTLKKVDWQNSRVAAGSIADEVARLKQVPGDGVLPVGGSELAASFLEQGLMDELHIILTPILLGGGKTVFDGIKKRYPLRLLSTKKFKSGNVVVAYEPTLR
jgi:dihydrofolate reductase